MVEWDWTETKKGSKQASSCIGMYEVCCLLPDLIHVEAVNTRRSRCEMLDRAAETWKSVAQLVIKGPAAVVLTDLI